EISLKKLLTVGSAMRPTCQSEKTQQSDTNFMDKKRRLMMLVMVTETARECTCIHAPLADD
ncbi:MAG: hypothetical protein ACI9X0_001910, partial [Kiritimatiellia bacterium]